MPAASAAPRACGEVANPRCRSASHSPTQPAPGCRCATAPWRACRPAPASSLRASTMMTPPKPGDNRAPSRSNAVADRITIRRSNGGTYSACDQSVGVNSASAQQTLELAAAVGPAMPERRRIDTRPYAGAVRHHQQQSALRRQHPPDLAQQRLDALGHFEAVDRQQLVDGIVRQRQLVGSHQRAQPRPVVRPHHRALLLRHQRAEPHRLAAERRQVGRRKAEPDHGLAIDPPPARANAMHRAAGARCAPSAARRNREGL